MSKQSMKEAVASLQKYMNTYSKQKHYESYEEETFIDDVLYGLGVALDPEKYSQASGYSRFKHKLRLHLQTTELRDIAQITEDAVFGMEHKEEV